MTSTTHTRSNGFTGAILRFLASLLPWTQQADAADHWVTAARSASARDRAALVRRAARAVVTADRRSPVDPGLAHVVALGRLRLAAAFSAASVLFFLSFGVGWIFGEPTVFTIVAGVLGLAWAVAAVVVLRLVVPLLGSRARLLFVATTAALAVVALSAVVSAAAPSEALVLMALAMAVVTTCALSALSWSMHLGSAGRGPRGTFRVMPLALGLVVLAIGCGLTAVVWRPLLSAPGMSLSEISGALSASDETPVLVVVSVVWFLIMVVGVLGTVALLVLGSRGGWLGASSARALVAAAGVAVIVVEFVISFSIGMNISDVPMTTGDDGIATLFLGIIGLALAAVALVDGARHPYPSPRAVAA